MRTFRLVAVASLLALAGLASSSPTMLAAGATSETYRASYQHVDDHAPGEQYVFDVEAIFHLTSRPDGTTSAVNNQRQVQTHIVDGVVVDVIESNQIQVAVLDGEDAIVIHSGSHDRYASGDEACETTIVWQVVDGELVVQQFRSICR